jgi:hypothetical protein
MTAISLLRTATAVHFLTDGAVFGAASSASTHASKVFPIPHLNCAVAARGPTLAPAIMAQMLGGVATYDEMKEAAPDMLRGCIALFGHMWRSAVTTGDECEIFVGGFSETTGADSFALVTHDRYPGIAAWQVAQLGELALTPADPAITDRFWERALARNTEATCLADLDPAADGLELLRAQRDIAVDGPMGHVALAGRFAQLTTVTRGGVHTRILERWEGAERPSAVNLDNPAQGSPLLVA